MDPVRKAERLFGKSLESLTWLLPEPDDTAEAKAEALLEIAKAALSGGQHGRRSAAADLDEPEWWQFYFERMARRDMDEIANHTRMMLGMEGPMEPEQAAVFVRDLIEESGVPKYSAGAYGIIGVPGIPEGHKFIVHDGCPTHSGRLADLDYDDPDLEAAIHHLPWPYAALVALAHSTERLEKVEREWSAFDWQAYIFCGIVAPRPWLGIRYSADRLNVGVELMIPTLAVTPEQVRALYERARDAIQTTYEERGAGRALPMPKAVSAERIALVRFVDEYLATHRMPEDTAETKWEWLRTAWIDSGQGKAYASWQLMKSAYYAAANPVRVVKKSGGSERS